MSLCEELDKSACPTRSVSLTPSGVLQVAALDCPSRIAIAESSDGMAICLTINGLTEHFSRSAVQAISISTLSGRSWVEIDGRLSIRAEVLTN